MKRALVLLALAALPGCWWSPSPITPHGNVEMDPAKLPALVAGQPVALKSSRLVVFGRFESTAPQPIGGLYDHDDYSITPLSRTYFFRDAPLEVFEASCDHLRACGLDVRKDYATSGEPTLVEQRLRARNPLLVSATITMLQNDQIRTDSDPPRDFEIARLVVAVRVRDLRGAVRYQRDVTIEGRVPAAESTDLLRTLGLRLGDVLVHDGDFLRAVEASS